jgi:hypothetical protein
LIRPQLPKGWAFALVIATLGDGGLMTYVSNVQRNDMIHLLREVAGKLERGEPTL